jgi:hypothetical protein
MARLKKQIRFAILQRDNFACRYCGRRAPDVVLHVDHIEPTSRGGTDDPANLTAACEDCNGGKRDTLIAFPEWLKKIQTARERDALLHVQFYCRNSDCPAREIDVYLKDYDSTLADFLCTKRGGRCPICGQSRMAVHSAMTAEEFEKYREKEARSSVLIQRHFRDHGAFISSEVLCSSPTIDDLFEPRRMQHD